jgi:hypothetical protein
MLREQTLALSGLIILLMGGLFLAEPSNVFLGKDSTILEINPLPFNSADLEIHLSYRESANITVVFAEEASAHRREVWPVITYSFPTKTLGETPVRFINQSVVFFILGWQNVSYSTLFITGFMIRLFYHGNESTSANVTITKTGGSLVTAGVALLLISAIPFWSHALISRRK